MLDEELDKIINDAAKQHHPAYDDKAWGKMLVLLDKHLTQKKDRRKPFAFLLLFLLLGGTVTTVIVQPWKSKNTAEKTGSTIAANTTVAAKASATKSNTGAIEIIPGTAETKKTEAANNKLYNNSTATKKPAEPANNNKTKAITAAATVNSTPLKNVTVAGKNNFTRKGRTNIKVKKPASVLDNNQTEIKKVYGKTKTTVKAAATFEDEVTTTTIPVIATVTDVAAAEVVSTDTGITKPQQKDTAAVEQKTTAASQTIKKQNSSKSFKNNFAFTFSAGADASFIKTANPGQTKFIYGAGVAYTAFNRIRISTGIFASKKVYDAEPYQYKFPSGTNFPNLWRIKANCMIYEIPVNIHYSFRQVKKHNWFAGGGISSIIMKEEKYDYVYKTPTGQYYSYLLTYKNKNQHFLSVITVSGGYQYKLNNRIQLIAEPYIKMPLSGIGAGAIKLKSSGILFTASVKPFTKK